MEKRKYKVGIVTLSDKGSRGEREDVSGPKIQELLPDDQYEVVSYRILPDEQAAIEKELCRLADEEHCALVLRHAARAQARPRVRRGVRRQDALRAQGA